MAFSPQRLRDAREALKEHGRKISQERFAELIGVSRRSPGRWENGEAEPRMTQLVKIALVTGRPVGFFFDDPAVSPTVDEPELMATLLERLADGLHAQARELRADTLPEEQVA